MAILALVVSLSLNAEHLPTSEQKAGAPDVPRATKAKPFLRILVVDQSGAVIPNAIIQLRSETNQVLAEDLADKNGRAQLAFVSGTCTILVMERGFASWKMRFETTSRLDELIKAELRVGSFSGPFVVAYEPHAPQTERYMPNIELALETSMLLELPARKRHPRFHF
jgi:hypothetical protein